jgi:hypothetical protein
MGKTRHSRDFLAGEEFSASKRITSPPSRPSISLSSRSNSANGDNKVASLARVRVQSASGGDSRELKDKTERVRKSRILRVQSAIDAQVSSQSQIKLENDSAPDENTGTKLKTKIVRATSYAEK